MLPPQEAKGVLLKVHTFLDFAVEQWKDYVPALHIMELPSIQVLRICCCRVG
jgi:hypothetical protein